MTTRDLANKRITVALGASNAVADLSEPTAAELNAMLNASEAIRWDGYDYGAQASDQVDDRTLADDAGATIRGFSQFGGGMPAMLPKPSDSSSILRQVFNLLKTPRTIIIVAERVGFKSSGEAFAAGDNVNMGLVMVDGFMPDTEGTGGYAAVYNLIPQGTFYPWTIVADASPAAITQIGGATIAVAAGARALRGAAYQGNVITARGTWTSEDAAVAKIVGKGIVEGVAAGTVDINVDFPGGTQLSFATTVS
jgi:hypothetical protein